MITLNTADVGAYNINRCEIIKDSKDNYPEKISGDIEIKAQRNGSLSPLLSSIRPFDSNHHLLDPLYPSVYTHVTDSNTKEILGCCKVELVTFEELKKEV